MFSMLHPLDEITPLVCKSGGKVTSLDVSLGVHQYGIKCLMCHLSIFSITEFANNHSFKNSEVGCFSCFVNTENVQESNPDCGRKRVGKMLTL